MAAIFGGIKASATKTATNRFRMVSILLWISSALANSKLFNRLVGGEIYASDPVTWLIMSVWNNYFFGALALQLILTVCQSNIWLGKGLDTASVVALLIGTVINIFALWPVTRNLDSSGIITPLSEGLGTDWTLGKAGCLIITVLLAIGMEGGPEVLWAKSKQSTGGR